MYYLKRLMQLDYRRMFNILKKISKRSSKSMLFILIDIIRCSRKYGSGYMDYYCFGFENLNEEQRSTYITRTISNNYCKKMNDPAYYYVMEDKPTFLKTYKNYIKRDYIDLRNGTYNEYLTFISEHAKFIAKPCDELCGVGIEVIDSADYSIDNLYKKLCDNKQYLLEELIDQCEELNRLYNKAINTIRVVTCNNDGEVSILFQCLRMGNGGSIDNFNHGGIFTIIDEDNCISRPACDKDGNEYNKHPYSGVDIIGFKVPMMKEVHELVKEMALITPEIGYCGWDIALSKSGPCVVECNEMPGYDLYQYPAHLRPKYIGLKPLFDKKIYSK